MNDSTANASGRTPPQPDQLIRWTTLATVILLAAIAAVVSYRHLHTLAVRHGEASWSAALLPISVDGMILASSMALLADSRRGQRGGLLPWALLVIGSLASVAANIAVAEPTLIGRAVAAWPAFALIGSMEMAFRLARRSAARPPLPADDCDSPVDADNCRRGKVVQAEAWQWALSHRTPDGSLPSGDQVAAAFERSPRWGRHVKRAGLAGSYQ